MTLPSFLGKPPKAPQPSVEADGHADLTTLDFSVVGGDFVRSAMGGMEVHDDAEDATALAEQAAVLFANGESAESEKLLRGVLQDKAADVGEGLWMMLIALYRLNGKREEFDTLVLEYATRFEKSPPPWEDLSGRSAVSAANSAPLVSPGENLNAQSGPQITQIKAVGRKSGRLRIDVGRLRTVDGHGAMLLLAGLKEMAMDQVQIRFMNCAALAERLMAQLEPGQRKERGLWLLALELLQHTGDAERFEQLALDYAVTFEESPPSWLAAPLNPAEANMEFEISTEMDNQFRLEGEITSHSIEGLRQVAALASSRSTLEVDCSRLRRMDFVSAGHFFNILKTLQAQGKVVILKNVNALVAALLGIMGVDQVAQVQVKS